jgi:hypothetical protein
VEEEKKVFHLCHQNEKFVGNQGHQHNSWYNFSYKKKSMSLERLSHLHKIIFYP